MHNLLLSAIFRRVEIFLTVVFGAGMAAGWLYGLSAQATAHLQTQVEPLVLSSMSPALVTNTQSAVLNLYGSGFTSTFTVTVGFGILAQTGFITTTHVTAVLPVHYPAGRWTVSVTNQDGQFSNPPLWLEVQNPIPFILSVSPSSLPNDQPATLLISGTGFVPTPTVLVGSLALSGVRVISDTLLEAHLPWGMDPGVYSLTLKNPGPGEPHASLSRALTVTAALGVWTTGGPYGGTIDRLRAHSSQPGTIYALADRVGLFRTQDGGQHWSQLPVHALGFDQAFSNPQVLYTAWYDIFRSADGGDTWVQFKTPAWVGSVFVHPQHENWVFATDTRYYEVPLYASFDGGQTWITRTLGISDTKIADLAFDPLDPQTLYLVTHQGSLYRSSDLGAHWNFVHHFAGYDLGVVSVDPYPPYTVWVGSLQKDGTSQYGTLHKSARDDLTTWQEPFTPPGEWGGATSIVFDLQTPGRMAAVVRGLLFVSQDYGGTWAHKPDPASFHLRQTLFASGNIFTGLWGNGVHVSEDGGDTWADASQGLAGLVPAFITPDPAQPERVWFGSFGLYGSENGGRAWQQESVIEFNHWMTPDLFIPGRFYLAWVEGPMIMQDGPTQVFTHVVISTPIPPWCTGCWGVSGPYALGTDPHIPGRLLMSLGMNAPVPSGEPFTWPAVLYESLDYGLTWHEVISAGLRSALMKIQFSLDNPQRVYAAGYDGILRSDDGGQSWQNITPPLLKGTLLYSLAVHPQSGEILATSGFGAAGGVHISLDGGQTWRQSNVGGGNLLVFTTRRPFSLFFGTWDGLVRSDDLGQTWERAAGLLGSAEINGLAYGAADGRDVLYISTPGAWLAPADRAAPSAALLSAGVHRLVTAAQTWLFAPVLRR